MSPYRRRDGLDKNPVRIQRRPRYLSRPRAVPNFPVWLHPCLNFLGAQGRCVGLSRPSLRIASDRSQTVR